MPADEVSHLAIGRVVAPRGVRGELKIAIETGDPERFRRLHHVYLGEDLVPFKVRRGRLHRGQALLQLCGVEDRRTAEQWRDVWVYVAKEEAIPLEEDEYYDHQILGLQVVTVEGEALGHVTEVLHTGANDVYVAQGSDGEMLIPAIEDVIVRVDLDEDTLWVRPLEGWR